MTTAAAIRALAEENGVAYVQTDTDVWAGHVSGVLGDDVILDEIELLLIALVRAGSLTRPEALALQGDYLHEKVQKV
jgi:hypothetical protein